MWNSVFEEGTKVLGRTKGAALLATTAGLVALGASAQEVELRMVEGNQTLRGQLMSQTETHVVIESRFGEISVDKRDVVCASGNCPWEDVSVALETPLDPDLPATASVEQAAAASPSTGLAARTIVPAPSITPATSATPAQSATDTAAVAAATATAAVAATSLTRELPKRSLLEPDLMIRGSDTVGADLMPLLIEGFANMRSGAVAKREDQGEDLVALDVRTDFGTGDRMFVAAVESKGSSAGIRALLNEETDIAMASRPARGSEVEALAGQGRGDMRALTQEYIVAVDSILVVVSPDNPISELPVGTVADLFSGRIQNWAEIGGPDLPVTVYTRHDGSGTRSVFTGAVLTPQQAQMSPAARVAGTNAEMADMVAADAGGIGFVGFASVRNAKPVDLVSSCGIRMDASVFGAKTEEYPLERRLRLFVDNDDLDETTQGLLEYAVSIDAEFLVQKAGFIDLGVIESEPGLDGERIRNAANEARDPFATRMLSSMATDLGGARRLSTTFRFATGSSLLDNKARRDLSRMVEYLSRPNNRGREVLVVGFTDSDGPFSANAALSQRRAEAVMQAIWSTPGAEELADLSMRATGYSELSPVACNDNFQGRQRNRRVEVWIR